VPGGAALRKQIYESKSAAEILARVEEFFEARLSAAAGAPAREFGNDAAHELAHQSTD
jgi:hypothetical protein